MFSSLLDFDSAKSLGLQHYFTGVPCKNGHVSYRYTCDKTCHECRVEKFKRNYKAHYEKNKTKVLEKNARWRLNNPESLKASQLKADEKRSGTEVRKRNERNSYARHREKRLEKKKILRQTNPDLVNSYRIKSIEKIKKEKPYYYAEKQAKVRATKKRATPSWADFSKIEIEYSLAAWCSKVMNDSYHVDHIVPLNSKYVCGLHVHDNLRVIHGIENIKKGNRVWPDMW